MAQVISTAARGATADGRLAELIQTTVQCYLTMIPELHSPKGRASLAQITAALSGGETAE